MVAGQALVRLHHVCCAVSAALSQSRARCIMLRVCYAMSSTDLKSLSRCIMVCVCYAMPSTILARQVYLDPCTNPSSLSTQVEAEAACKQWLVSDLLKGGQLQNVDCVSTDGFDQVPFNLPHRPHPLRQNDSLDQVETACVSALLHHFDLLDLVRQVRSARARGTATLY